MRELFILFAHLLATIAKLAKPGGLGVVAAESVALKHQLLIMKRRQHRAPSLTPWDRLVLGICALFASPKRLEDGHDTEALDAFVLVNAGLILTHLPQRTPK